MFQLKVGLYQPPVVILRVAGNVVPRPKWATPVPTLECVHFHRQNHCVFCATALAAVVFSGLVGIVLSHCRQSFTTCPDMAWVVETKLTHF